MSKLLIRNLQHLSKPLIQTYSLNTGFKKKKETLWFLVKYIFPEVNFLVKRYEVWIIYLIQFLH